MSQMVTFTAESIESVTAVVGTKWGPLRVLWSESGGLRLDRCPPQAGQPTGLRLDEVREMLSALKGGSKLGGDLQEQKRAVETAGAERVQAMTEVLKRAVNAPDVAIDVAKPTPVVLAREAEPPPVKLAEVEDMGIFARLTKFEDIIAEIRKRGAATYEDISAYVRQIDEAECCPALDRIKRQGPLEDRLRSRCVALNIPGALE